MMNQTSTIQALFKYLATPKAMKDFCLSMTLSFVAVLVMMAVPGEAMAQSTLNLPIVSSLGCTVATWMKGPLAVVIFVVVVICIFIVGMIAKMDWSKLIFICVIYGLIQGFVSFMISGGYLNISSLGCSL
jgi:type IV secretory pathway VirB2 component (pilin)